MTNMYYIKYPIRLIQERTVLSANTLVNLTEAQANRIKAKDPSFAVVVGQAKRDMYLADIEEALRKDPDCREVNKLAFSDEIAQEVLNAIKAKDKKRSPEATE